jgi:predicted neuraminidase
VNRFILIVLACVLVTSAAVGAPVYEAQRIFPGQEKHVHSSSIVECPNGDLLVCWFYGSGERTAADVKVQGARLRKGEAEWSSVFPMTDTPNFPDCNPVLFIDRQERLWMFWIAVLAEGWEHSLLKYRVTSDYLGDGPPKWDWQEVITLKPGQAFADAMKAGFEEIDLDQEMWAEYALPYSELLLEAAQDPFKRQMGWMTRTHPLQLPNGRILLPLYSDGFNASLVAISDDDGATWRASLPMIGRGPIQPSVVRKQDGTLVAYLRDSGDAPNRAMKSTSTDDGETWSVALDTDIPNPGSSLEAIALADGLWVMVYNDTERGRHSLAAALSDDEGKTWKWERHLEKGKGSFGYPSVIQGRDGVVHATYSHHLGGDDKAIKHAAFSVEWIKQGD